MNKPEKYKIALIGIHILYTYIVRLYTIITNAYSIDANANIQLDN